MRMFCVSQQQIDLLRIFKSYFDLILNVDSRLDSKLFDFMSLFKESVKWEQTLKLLRNTRSYMSVHDPS